MQADTTHHNSQTARHSSPLYMTLLQYIIMYSGRYIQNFAIMLTFAHSKHRRSNWQAKGEK